MISGWNHKVDDASNGKPGIFNTEERGTVVFNNVNGKFEALGYRLENGIAIPDLIPLNKISQYTITCSELYAGGSIDSSSRTILEEAFKHKHPVYIQSNVVYVNTLDREFFEFVASANVMMDDSGYIVANVPVYGPSGLIIRYNKSNNIVDIIGY